MWVSLSRFECVFLEVSASGDLLSFRRWNSVLTRQANRNRLVGAFHQRIDGVGYRNWRLSLQLFVELTRRAGNINPARYVALTVFHALDDARSLAALGAIRALAGVHHLLTVRCFCNLRAYCHDSFLLISLDVCAAIRRIPAADIVYGVFQQSRPELAAETGNPLWRILLLRLVSLPSLFILQ
jgi:hypothetical protein